MSCRIESQANAAMTHEKLHLDAARWSAPSQHEAERPLPPHSITPDRPIPHERDLEPPKLLPHAWRAQRRKLTLPVVPPLRVLRHHPRSQPGMTHQLPVAVAEPAEQPQQPRLRQPARIEHADRANP